MSRKGPIRVGGAAPINMNPEVIDEYGRAFERDLTVLDLVDAATGDEFLFALVPDPEHARDLVDLWNARLEPEARAALTPAPAPKMSPETIARLSGAAAKQPIGKCIGYRTEEEGIVCGAPARWICVGRGGVVCAKHRCDCCVKSA